MATFHYRAVTAAGRWQEGTREGRTEKVVARDLQTMGLTPVYIGVSPEASGAGGGGWLGSLLSKGEAPASGGARPLWSGNRVTSRDRLLFTQELATLLTRRLRHSRPLGRPVAADARRALAAFDRAISLDPGLAGPNASAISMCREALAAESGGR